MSDCIFCSIVAGESPARIVYRDEDVTAFRDAYPCAPTHILIVPNRHAVGGEQLLQDDAEVLGRLFLVAQQLAEREGVMGGYRLVVNYGPGAGQSVLHLHVHLLGGRVMGWPPG